MDPRKINITCVFRSCVLLILILLAPMRLPIRRGNSLDNSSCPKCAWIFFTNSWRKSWFSAKEFWRNIKETWSYLGKSWKSGRWCGKNSSISELNHIDYIESSQSSLALLIPGLYTEQKRKTKNFPQTVNWACSQDLSLGFWAEAKGEILGTRFHRQNLKNKWHQRRYSSEKKTWYKSPQKTQLKSLGFWDLVSFIDSEFRIEITHELYSFSWIPCLIIYSNLW